MGVSDSKLEEDISLKLCRDRKKYVKKALDGRCFLAHAHITYMQSLRNTRRVLRELFELDVPTESSLYISTTNETVETLVPNERHESGISFSPITDSPFSYPFPVTFLASHTKLRGNSSVSELVAGRVTVPDAPHNTLEHPVEKHESISSPSPAPAETLPWDYFDLSHPVDDQLSPQEINGRNEGLNRGGENRTFNAWDEKKANDPNHKIFESEDEDETNFDLGRNDSDESDKDRDEPLSEGSVKSCNNINMASDIMGADLSPSIASESTEISEILPGERSRSPDLSPLRATALSVSLPVNLKKLVDTEEAYFIENNVGSTGNKDCHKDLFLRMRDIDQLFFEACESGHEVLRMLEANKLYFRPLLPKQKGKIKLFGMISSYLTEAETPLILEGESKISWCLNACLSYQAEPGQVLEDPAQTSTRYLAGQRTMHARSFSSMDATAGQNARDNDLANSTIDLYCMISGSHASTLDRLYAWEKKLYDEVKASQVLRHSYDLKCKLLGRQESRGELVDKTRAVIKDLHSRIRVSIKRMESISMKIKKIRDDELQPQLEELAKGLGRMWKMMLGCHKLQFDLISVAVSKGTKVSINPESHQQIIYHLEQQLSLMSLYFTTWIAAQKSYLQAIDGWLLKCVKFPEKSLRKFKRHQPVSIREYGPPVFTTCGNWLEGLEKFSIVAETSRLLRPQQRHHGDNGKAKNSSIWLSDFDNLISSLMQFFCQLKILSESSVNMYKELDNSIQEAKRNYEQLLKPHS